MSFCVDCFGQAREGAPLTPDEVLQRFKEAADFVWQRPVSQRLTIILNNDPASEKKLVKHGSLAAVVYRTMPRAIVSGRHLVRPFGEGVYKLQTTPELFLLDDDSVWKILIHEAVHIGYPNHGKAFQEVVAECGGVATGAQLEEGYKVLIERKDPGKARYVVAGEFDTVEEALAWGRAEARTPGKYPPGTRWRMKQ